MTVKVDDLPASIRVGPYQISITVVSKLNRDNDYGEFHFDGQRITVRKSYKSTALAVTTVLHELIHAMWAAYELPNRPNEEQVAGSLSTCLTQVLLDNPDFLCWLKNKLLTTVTK